MGKSSEDRSSSEDVSAEKNVSTPAKIQIVQRIRQSSQSNDKRNTISDLKQLYKSQNDTDIEKRIT